MGIRRFFRWLSDTYSSSVTYGPPLAQPDQLQVAKVKEQLGDIDVLYIDFNSIIHEALGKVGAIGVGEFDMEQLMYAIWNKLDLLVAVLCPKKLYIAIDGVPPAAKMEHERASRFQRAYHLQDEICEYLEQLQGQGNMFVMQSNDISPGTAFMRDIRDGARKGLEKRLANGMWPAGVQAILTTDEEPGEGEHKIMYHLKASKTIGLTERACIYSPDADVVLLSLTAHRENIVIFNEGIRDREIVWYFMQVKQLRLAILEQFKTIVADDTQRAEAVLDDFVLLASFFGNDFLPPLSGLDASEKLGALSLVLQVYASGELGGFINNKGVINLVMFNRFLGLLFADETQSNLLRQLEFKYLSSVFNSGSAEAKMVPETNTIAEYMCQRGLSIGEAAQAMMNEQVLDYAPSSYRNLTYNMAYLNMNNDDKGAMWKAQYYKDVLRVQPPVAARAYTKAIQWVMLYYYGPCPSWRYTYDHHFGPLFSDLHDNFSVDEKYTYDTSLGPMDHVDHLLRILPAMSYQCMPAPYNSLIRHNYGGLYPHSCEVMQDGRVFAEREVVMLPHISDKVLAQGRHEVENKQSELVEQ